MKKVVIAAPSSASFGRKLAKKIRAPFASLIASHFPDGELKLKYPVPVKGKELIFVETMQPNPDEALIQLLFATASARVQGAKKVTLVIPYTGFLRQDKEFHRGEVVSNRIVAGLLSKANRVITMDPHLHRIKNLNEIFKTKTITLTANNILAEHIRKKHKGAIVVGPDEESYQWALSVAKLAKTKAIVLKKKRYNAEKVKIIVKSPFPLAGKHIVLVDDIISTGHTMIEPIKQFKQLNVKSITCIGVHGVFAKNALQKLRKLGAKVECTNTIETKASVIDVTSAFAKVL